MACATLKRTHDWDPLHSPSGRSNKRRRCTPVLMSQAANSTPARGQEPSAFGEVSPKLNSEQIAENIREEMKRLQRRRQLQYNLSEAHSPSDSSSPPSPIAGSGQHSPSRRDQPLFTFRQVGLICERMMKDREQLIREEYDQVLTSKLAEQYDTFVKFTYDQIQKRYETCTPSYLS